MIEVEHLRKEYGALKAVDDVSFQVAPGEVLGFLGPNGAGKSTTMKMLTGFLTPTSGGVKILGRDVQEDRIAAQSLMGYLPEGAPCYEEMTPAQFLKFIAQVRGFKGKDVAGAVARAVETLSLQTVLHQKIETLSKGFKRRVGLAQAILHDPEVLVLDEPTDGLDPNQKHQVRELIKGLSQDKIVIISTHILEEVTAVCNRVMVLSAGKIVVDTTPRELQARSRFHGAVCLTLEDPSANQAAVEALGRLSSVAGVETEGDLIYVFSGVGQIQTQVVECLSQNNWVCSSLAVESGRLDDVFRDLTKGAAA